MRISDWSSDVCSSDLKTLGFAEARRYLGRSLVLFLDHILERHAFVRSAHRQLAIFSIAEFDRVLGVGPNNDRYFEIFRKLALLDQRVHPRETAPAAEDAVLILRSEERRVGKACVSTCGTGW